MDQSAAKAQYCGSIPNPDAATAQYCSTSYPPIGTPVGGEAHRMPETGLALMWVVLAAVVLIHAGILLRPLVRRGTE